MKTTGALDACRPRLRMGPPAAALTAALVIVTLLGAAPAGKTAAPGAAASAPAPPSAPASPLQGAIALFKSGKTKEAKAAFEAILQKDPKNAEALFDLGRIAFAAQDFDGAAERFNRTIELVPDSSVYHMWVGRAYAQKTIKASNLKRPFLAPTVKREFEKAVALDPNNLDAHFDLARFYVLAPGLMGGNVEKAKTQAAAVKRLDALQGHQCYAMIYEETKQNELAEKEYEAALKENPGDRKTSFLVGLHYQSRGRFADAFEIFEKMARQEPPDRGALYQIGKTAIMSGKNLDRGEECLRLYLQGQPGENEPSLAWAHYRLGMLLEQKGDKTRARAEYTETLKLQPDHEEAKKALAKL